MSMPINEKDFFVNDFYKRTLSILHESHKDYEVTLILNLMVGLLVVPKEKYFDNKAIPDSFVSKELLDKVQKCITKNFIDGKTNSDNSLKEIIRNLRNAVAHGGLEIFRKDSYLKSFDEKIESIAFKNKGFFYSNKYKRRINVEFEIALTYDLLKSFLIEFATNICKQIEERNDKR